MRAPVADQARFLGANARRLYNIQAPTTIMGGSRKSSGRLVADGGEVGPPSSQRPPSLAGSPPAQGTRAMGPPA